MNINLVEENDVSLVNDPNEQHMRLDENLSKEILNILFKKGIQLPNKEKSEFYPIFLDQLILLYFSFLYELINVDSGKSRRMNAHCITGDLIDRL